MSRSLRWTEAELSQVQSKRLSAGTPKQNKYRNRKTTIDGIIFQSGEEARRYAELKLMQQAGIISNLQMQVPVDCVVNGIHVCKWIADFTYSDQGGKVIYEDVKGFILPIYKLKKKLVFACHGIEILET